MKEEIITMKNKSELQEEHEKRLKCCCYNNDGHCYLSIIGCMKDTECDAVIDNNKIICSCYTPSKKEV